MTKEALKKEIAKLKAQIREMNEAIERLRYRQDKKVQFEWMAEERDECHRQLEHYKKMLKGAEEW